MRSFEYISLNIYWTIPLLCAISCWLCISAILFFIFSPKETINFLGIKVQGLIYSKFDSIRNQVIDYIVKQILSNKNDIAQSLTSEENIEKIMPGIETHIQEFLTIKVPKELPMIAMFLGDKTTHQIKEVFMKELRVLFPKVLTQYIDASLDEKRLHEFIATQFSKSSETLIVTGFQRQCRSLFIKLKLYSFVFGLTIGYLLTFVIYLFA